MRIFLVALLLVCGSRAHAQEGPIDLFAKGLDAFRGPKFGDWQQVAEVGLDPANPRKLVAKEGQGGIWYNGAKGRTNDLFTKQKFGDAEVHLEFMMSKGSNSGIKFHGHYEVQICDSFGKKTLDGSDCGGIYPRATLRPRYQHIDAGVAPLVNACKAPGEWQTLDLKFKAPRFDAKGKKTENARLVKAVLNGQTIHDDVEWKTPTGHLWVSTEMAEGPIMIQGDHGPVALRNVKIRPIDMK